MKYKSVLYGLVGFIKKSWAIIVIFALFAVANSAYLSTVPGLVGDEGFEGRHVFDVLHTKGIELIGVNSYLSTVSSYFRIPFILIFGYTALGLRALTFIASILFFWLLWKLLRINFGEHALMGLVFVTFSPIYLNYQRVGWVITLLPLYLIIVLYFVSRNNDKTAVRDKILAGFFGGLALSTHFMFISSVALVIWMVAAKSAFNIKKMASWWVALIGAWAGFAIQFTVIYLHKDDQDLQFRTAAVFWDKLLDLPSALAATISSSSFVAVYTGNEFSRLAIVLILFAIAALVIAAFLSGKSRKVTLILLSGIAVQLLALTYFVAYFTIRYLTIPVLITWCLAGVGLSVLSTRLLSRRQMQLLACVVAVLLLTANYALTLRPYLASGGSMKPFKLSYREFGSDSFVATEDLVTCVKKNKGIVWSDNGTVFNRLQFLQLGDPHLYMAGPDGGGTLYVGYRKSEQREVGERCPDLKHFVVKKIPQPGPED